jgi:transcriptional regulator with XRE-family HTH domain
MPGLREQLRDAIRATGESTTAFAKRAGVDQAQVQRFMTGSRDIRLETAEKIVSALGLQLRTPARKRSAAKKKKSARKRKES